MNQDLSLSFDMERAGAGKPYVWRPAVPSGITLEPLAEDVRPEMQQLAHYTMACIAMQARLDETDDIIRALQQCERIHGFSRIGPTLVSLTATLENAVTLIPTSITVLGRKKQSGSPGLFVGSCIEGLAQIPQRHRQFPLSPYQERLQSPYMEFEDCEWGVGIATQFHLLSENNPQVSRPYSRLVAAFRQKHGQAGRMKVVETAREIQKQFVHRKLPASDFTLSQVMTFAQAIQHKAHETGVTLPALWRLYTQTLHA